MQHLHAPPEWQRLVEHAGQVRAGRLRDAFAEEAARFGIDAAEEPDAHDPWTTAMVRRYRAARS